MDNGTAYERVKNFIKEAEALPQEAVKTRVAEIENDIYTLFHSLEKIRSKYPEFKDLSFSDDLLALVRMLEHSKVKRQFPLLARAAAMF